MIKRAVPVLASLAAVAAFATTAALAAGSDFSSLTRHSDQASLGSPGQSAKVKVDCPAGKSAVSGGFDIGSITFTHGPLVTASRAKGGGWESRANEFASSGPQNDELTGDVNCGVKAPKITTKSASGQVGQGAVKSVVARCTGDKHAVAGGFKTRYFGGEPVSGAIVTASYRQGGKAWKVVASGISNLNRAGHARSAGRGSAATPLKAYVYCADVPALKAHSKRVTGTPENNGGHLHANPKCGKHEKAVSGGFRSEILKGGEFNQANVPEASRLKGKRGWTTSAYYQVFSDTSLDWRGYVYCAK